MKIIKYKTLEQVNYGTEENPEVLSYFSNVQMGWSEANEKLAKIEAYNNEYTIEDDGVEENIAPTQLDFIEAQVAYTAMMTDTLLEV